MREVVVGHGCRGGAVRSGALQDAMHEVQDGWNVRPAIAAVRSGRPGDRSSYSTCHLGIIRQLAADVQARRWVQVFCWYAGSALLCRGLLPAAPAAASAWSPDMAGLGRRIALSR